MRDENLISRLIIWMNNRFPIRMFFYKDNLQLRIKKLNDSDYEIHTTKIHVLCLSMQLLLHMLNQEPKLPQLPEACHIGLCDN